MPNSFGMVYTYVAVFVVNNKVFNFVESQTFVTGSKMWMKFTGNTLKGSF